MPVTTKYLNEIEVAELTGRALSTLRNERAKGQGIPYIKIGRSVRYDIDDVILFMNSHKIRTQNDRYEVLDNSNSGQDDNLPGNPQ